MTDLGRCLLAVTASGALLTGMGLLLVELWRAFSGSDKFTCDDCPNRKNEEKPRC